MVSVEFRCSHHSISFSCFCVKFVDFAAFFGAVIPGAGNDDERNDAFVVDGVVDGAVDDVDDDNDGGLAFLTSLSQLKK
jgi:hypothetical protein